MKAVPRTGIRVASTILLICGLYCVSNAQKPTPTPPPEITLDDFSRTRDLGVGDLGGREEGEEGVRQGGECAVRGASLFAANLGISPKWGIFVSSQLTEDGRQMGIFILRTYIDFWLF